MVYVYTPVNSFLSINSMDYPPNFLGLRRIVIFFDYFIRFFQISCEKELYFRRLGQRR